jgi:hypothetical protein
MNNENPPTEYVAPIEQTAQDLGKLAPTEAPYKATKLFRAQSGVGTAIDGLTRLTFPDIPEYYVCLFWGYGDIQISIIQGTGSDDTSIQISTPQSAQPAEIGNTVRVVVPGFSRTLTMKNSTNGSVPHRYCVAAISGYDPTHIF